MDRRLVIIVTLLVVVIGGLALLGRSNNNENTGKVKDVTNGQGNYYDSNSKETVSNPSGKTPENYGATAGAPIYLGLNGLLDYGVASDQVGDYRFAIYQYFKSNHMKASEVSIAVDSVVPTPRDPDSSSTINTINFNIVVDRKTTYKVKMDYFDLSSINLQLFDSTGAKLLYDSGTVSNQNVY